MRKRILASIAILSSILAHGQEKYWVKPDSLYKFVQPVASLQFWSTYTRHERARLADNGPLESVQDRLGFMIRRARIGFKGTPYKKLNYVLTVQYDNLGKDRFSGVRGSANSAASLGILDAYATYRVSNNDMLAVTIGYFNPQISRECITGDLLVNSLDKSVSQTYIRQHVDGKSYGRATGMNIGGMTHGHQVTIGYNVGIFNNVTTSGDFTDTSGKYWSPLVVDRVTFSFGDPDMKSYAINYDANNFFDQRKGITIGLNSSIQGRTDAFHSNSVEGFDVLLNYGHLNLDGEWLWLNRRGEGNTVHAQTGHVRAGYNMVVAKKYYLEPCIMFTHYTGDDDMPSTGEDTLLDVGVNWYLNKKNCKLSLHYIMQEGHGDNGYTDGTTFQKGDYAGLAFVLLI